MADTTTRKPGNPAGIPVSTTTPKPTREFGKLGPHASDVLLGLVDRAQDNLSEADQTALLFAGETARTSIRHLSRVCEGLACLIAADDGENGTGTGTGSFQTAENVSGLLFLLAAVTDQAHGFLEIANGAELSLELARRARGAA